MYNGTHRVVFMCAGMKTTFCKWKGFHWWWLTIHDCIRIYVWVAIRHSTSTFTLSSSSPSCAKRISKHFYTAGCCTVVCQFKICLNLLFFCGRKNFEVESTTAAAAYHHKFKIFLLIHDGNNYEWSSCKLSPQLPSYDMDLSSYFYSFSIVVFFFFCCTIAVCWQTHKT